MINEEIFNTAKSAIDKMVKDNIGLAMIKASNKTDLVNRIGMNLGIEKMSLDEPEMYEAVISYLREKLNPQKMDKEMNINNQLSLFNESKNALKESSHEIQTPKVILRYDNDIVVKSIKDIIKKEFKNITFEQIKGDEGGAFYSMILSLELDEDIKNDLELKRFKIMQTLSSFKGKFFGAISSVLPVINIRTGSYQFSKQSTKMRFEAVICLSHTNDRDWVSGVYKGTEKNIDSTEKLEEASSSKKSMIKPITLRKAIQRYKSNKIDIKMLETAIKACGRAELEYYVLKSVGINPDVDLGGAEDVENPTQSENIESDGEVAYKPEGIQESLKEMAGKRFDTATFDYMETENRDVFDVIAELQKLGCKAAAETISRLHVRWPNNKFSKEDIQKIINGNSKKNK